MDTQIKLYEIKFLDKKNKEVIKYEVYETTIRKAWKWFYNYRPQITVGYIAKAIYPADDKNKERMLLVNESNSCSVWVTELKVVSGNGR
jgi:hypothetical protein